MVNFWKHISRQGRLYGLSEVTLGSKNGIPKARSQRRVGVKVKRTGLCNPEPIRDEVAVCTTSSGSTKTAADPSSVNTPTPPRLATGPASIPSIAGLQSSSQCGFLPVTRTTCGHIAQGNKCPDRNSFYIIIAWARIDGDWWPVLQISQPCGHPNYALPGDLFRSLKALGYSDVCIQSRPFKRCDLPVLSPEPGPPLEEGGTWA